MTEFRFPPLSFPSSGAPTGRDEGKLPRLDRTHTFRQYESSSPCSCGIEPHAKGRVDVERLHSFYKDHSHFLKVTDEETGSCSRREQLRLNPRHLRELFEMYPNRPIERERLPRHGSSRSHLPPWPFPTPTCAFPPPGPQPFARVADSCHDSRPDLLRLYHNAAFHWYVEPARGSLSYMAKLPVNLKQILWNWGDNNSSNRWMWSQRDDARFASLAFWFGTFSEERFATVLAAFTQMKVYFTKGIEIFGVWGSVRYWCSGDTNCAARHPYGGRNIEICQPFWSNAGNNDAERLYARTSALLHESVHHLFGVGNPRDLVNFKACSWPFPADTCYEHPLSLRFPWTAGTHPASPVDPTPPGNPRSLALFLDAEGKAFKNVDNYVGWALRRFFDPQWGFCFGPLPPPHP